jgi:hypothetical protein
MPNIDIPVPDELQELMAAPKCLDLRPPLPQQLKVTLPSGGTLTALHDLGKSIPNDCSLTFSLMLQIMPLMASMECLLKVLKLLKPLTDAVTSPPPTPKLIKEIIQAVADLAPCFLMVTPAGMIPFVRDILCLVLALLRCLIGQMETLNELLGGLTLQIADAEKAGNRALAESLKCAQENGLIEMQHLMNGFGPVSVVLDLMSPMMSIAGVGAIKLPALGNEASAAAVGKTLDTLQQTVDTIQSVVDVLGGCPK